MKSKDKDNCERANDVAKLQYLNTHPCLLMFSNLAYYFIILIIKHKSARGNISSEAVQHTSFNSLAKDMISQCKNQIHK